MTCPTTNPAAYVKPGVADFKSFFDRDFGFSTSGVNATARVVINAEGQVTSVEPVDLGNGYTGAPAVSIIDANDGPGTGALVSANFAAQNDGQITSYTVNAAGAGYVNPYAKIKGGGVDDTNMAFVRDTDVNKALLMAGVNFNASLWNDQDEYQVAYLYKAAHFLALNLRGAAQGIRGRGGEWLRTAFNVAEIGASFDFPMRVKKSSVFAPLLETTYGSTYVSMVAPRTIANVMAAIGHTKP